MNNSKRNSYVSWYSGATYVVYNAETNQRCRVLADEVTSVLTCIFGAEYKEYPAETVGGRKHAIVCKAGELPHATLSTCTGCANNVDGRCIRRVPCIALTLHTFGIESRAHLVPEEQ